MNISKPVAGGVAIAIAIVSFFGGSYYGGSKTGGAAQGGAQAGNGMMRQGGNFGGRAGGQGGARGGAQGGFVNGEVVSLDATSMTVKMRDGSSKVVFYSKETTTVQKSVEGALNDVQTGTTVMVMGKPNTDGSVTAESVQIRPAGSDRPRATPTE